MSVAIRSSILFTIRIDRFVYLAIKKSPKALIGDGSDHPRAFAERYDYYYLLISFIIDVEFFSRPVR